MSNLENPTVGSRKRHPQIWDGPIAYHTFANKICMANLAPYGLCKGIWCIWAMWQPSKGAHCYLGRSQCVYLVFVKCPKTMAGVFFSVLACKLEAIKMRSYMGYRYNMAWPNSTTFEDRCWSTSPIVEQNLPIVKAVKVWLSYKSRWSSQKYGVS